MLRVRAFLLIGCSCLFFFTSSYAQVVSKPCPVDTHGVLLDTDDYGVADCFDKEKLTKLECMPVDSIGVGTCPEPACCYHGIVDDFSCHLTFFPSFHFTNGCYLSEKQKNILDTIRLGMMNSPSCIVIIKGYYSLTSKGTKFVTAKRLKQISNYLISNDVIAEERIKVILQAGTYIDYINILPSSR